MGARRRHRPGPGPTAPGAAGQGAPALRRCGWPGLAWGPFSRGSRDCLTKEGRKLWSGPPHRKDPGRIMNPFTLIPPAYAQDAGGNFLSSATQFAPLILIFAVFYFMLIRP